MAERKRSINFSVGRIRKEVPGNHLATAGSACLLEWPWNIEQTHLQATASSSEIKTQTFLVATSQVVSRRDMNSSAVCKADFLPLKWGSTETFSLNNVPLNEVPITGHNNNITLILIPTEPLHKQRKMPWLWKNDLKSYRPQLCHRGSESQFQAADTKQSLYCFVLCETVTKNDRFFLECYFLDVEESGSYFLQVHGNKAKLRTLEDFHRTDRTENPIGSVILNGNGNVVGFLAFGEKSEILPVFLPRDLQGEVNQANDIVVNVDMPKNDSKCAEGCSITSSYDGQESEGKRSTDTEDDGDVNKFKGDNMVPGRLLHAKKLPVQEVTQTANSSSGQLRNGAKQGAGCNMPPFQRSHSEKTMTPRSQRKQLLKSRSEPVGRSPLKSGDLVEKVILCHVYAMDTLSRYLDISYSRNIANWQHLAHLQGVPTDRVMELKCQSPESRSEALFQVLPTVDPDLSISTLVIHLMDLEMNNVVKCIQDLHLDMSMEVGEFLDSGKVPGRFFTLLDQKPEETWKSLGTKLGIDNATLEGIKIDCATQHQNPAKHVIEMIYTSNPTLTIDQFKKHLENITRNDVKKKLDNLPADQYETITDLRDDVDLLRVVTRMLNDPSQIKNFMDLAEECGISPEKRRSLQPPCAASPTEEVIKDIVGRKPFYNVAALFTDLSNMGRLDVIEAMSLHFIEEDVKELKRKLKITEK